MKKLLTIAPVYGLVIFTLLLCVALGNEAVTTLAENKPIEREHCIVIDPGHGGEDGGAVSLSGRPESAYNLEISLRLNDLLNLIGYKTKMIRISDTSIYTKGETLAQKKVSDLKERVRQINETEDAVLLSIHQNHFPDDRYSGAQVFYAKIAGSEELAKQMQAMFAATINPGNNRQAKRSSGVYIMEQVRCPAVLIECGFLSNPAEERKLQNPEYQKKMCSVIAAVTVQYLSNT